MDGNKYIYFKQIVQYTLTISHLYSNYSLSISVFITFNPLLYIENYSSMHLTPVASTCMSKTLAGKLYMKGSAQLSFDAI